MRYACSLPELLIDSREDGNFLVKLQHKPLQNWLMRLKKKMSILIEATIKHFFHLNPNTLLKYLFQLGKLFKCSIRII